MPKFMMDLELKLELPQRRHAIWSALVMGAAYLLGGLSGSSELVLANKV